jgi:hypothetical protein
VGCINGVRSNSHIIKDAIGLPVSETVGVPITNNINDLSERAVCIIKEESYMDDSSYFFAKSICIGADDENCVVYYKVNENGVVVDAWVDKDLTERWLEERRGKKPLTLRCDKNIRNQQDMDWRKWIR